MTRTLTVLVLGVLLGAGATLLLTPDRRARIESADSRRPDLSLVAPAGSSATEPDRDFYRRVADADAAELATLIAQAAARPRSTDRELALAVLLKRYAEIDAPRAALLAHETKARGVALESVYGAWARLEPAAALAALDAVEDPDDAAAAALALVVELGNDANAVERVASRLAAREARPPISSVVPAFGPGMMPLGAVASRSPLGLMAERWAQPDPERALELTRDIRDEPTRLALEATALRTLARAAPDRAFAYLSSFTTPSRQIALLGAAGPELARAHPERLLELSGDLVPGLRQIVETTALQQLADRDPLAATRYLERLPASAERQRLAQVVARAYGKRDPEAALAWARSSPERENAVASVIGGIAEENPDRALDLALELSSPTERMRAAQMVAMSGIRRDDAAEAIVNRLVGMDDPLLRDSVAMMAVSSWASQSPDGAMRWLIANGAKASSSMVQRVGQQLATRDPDSAIGYAAQMPASAREPWIHGVAQGYAQHDPQGSIDWLRGFRGEPWYARAASTLAQEVAQRDGAAAARFVDELEADRTSVQAQQLVVTIAVNWANDDPAAAAAWAIDRPNERSRVLAVRNVVGVWSSQDPVGARQWTLGLPQNAVRDGALATLLTMNMGRAPSELDLGLLNAFASDTARQAAVLQAVQTLAYADPARARVIADAHLTNPALRAQAESVFQTPRNAVGPAQGITFGISR